ncbi:peptidylprolyl isomerase [Methylophilaceae bacterium]|nr:peptidylprolyl isomerase [Methylophilaceae bacterium]
MVAKIYFIFVLILLQNILLISKTFSEETYIEVDSIIAIAETRTITKLELDKKKEKVKKSYLQRNLVIPSNKKITKQALDQLINEKLVIEYASNQGIAVSPEQLNNVINNIAKSNKLSIEEMIEDIESDGTNFSDFREDIRTQLIFDQVKRRRISSNLKISEFEIDNFIELQKERTPTKYNFSHIFIEFIKNNGEIDSEKTNLKLTQVLEKLKKKSFEEVAKNYSDGPMSEKGGNMGSRTPDEIPDLFLQPLKLMKSGELSKPLAGSAGYHLLKLNKIDEFEVETIIVKQSKVKQILLKKNQIISEDEIKKKLAHIRNLIIDGLSFSEAAEKYSEDSSAANKGDLGWLGPGDTIPEFEIEMDNLDLNEISQPVKTALGWHLIIVTDRRNQDLSAESLRQRVKEILLKQKTDIKFNDWVKTLKEGAHVEIWLYEY